MFKRKQRPTVPTTPPNFLDLRQTAPPPPSGDRVRIFSDITAPLMQQKYVWRAMLPARIGVVVVIGVLLTTVLVLTQGRPQTPFSSHILSEFKAQSFYPTHLPKGYQLQASSITVTGGALTFVASNGVKTQALFFSEQVLPKGTDLQGFYQTQIPDAVTAITPYGSAAIGHYANVSPLEREHLGANRIGNANTATIASLATPETWVIITGPSSFSLAQLKQVVLSLHD